MDKRTGFGIVGAGLVAPFHLKAIRDCENAVAIGVYDVRQERAGKIAEQFGAAAYDEFDDMLSDDSVDVVCVATPNHLHRDIVVQSANAGKHVLTEKPPAMSLAETDQMIAACEENGVKFGCFVQCRMREAVQAIRKALQDGRFGDLLRADTYMKWYRGPEYYSSDTWRASRKSGSGVTVAQGFHYIDLLQYLAGPVVRVQSDMHNINHPDAGLEDDAVTFLEYKNGAKGLIQLSTALWPGREIRLEIHGTRGAAVMVGDKFELWQFVDEQPEDERIRRIGNIEQATGAGGAADFDYYGHRTVIKDMVRAIAEDREVAIPTGSVRHTLEIVLAMYRSDARKEAVAWPVQDDDSVWDEL